MPFFTGTVQINAESLIALVVFSTFAGSLSVWLGATLGQRKQPKSEHPPENINAIRARFQAVISRERIISRGIIYGLTERSGIGRGDST